METVQLKPTWRTCPAGHIPFIFNGSYQCMRLPPAGVGLAGVGSVGWGLIFGVMLAGIGLAFALR